MTPGSQQPFLKTFEQAFKGAMSQNQLWIHITVYYLRAKYFIFEKVLGVNFFLTPLGMIPGDSVFSNLKVE